MNASFSVDTNVFLLKLVKFTAEKILTDGLNWAPFVRY